MTVTVERTTFGELATGDLFLMEANGRTAGSIAAQASTPVYLRGTGDPLGTRDFPVLRVRVEP